MNTIPDLKKHSVDRQKQNHQETASGSGDCSDATSAGQSCDPEEHEPKSSGSTEMASQVRIPALSLKTPGWRQAHSDSSSIRDNRGPRTGENMAQREPSREREEPGIERRG